MFIIDLRHTRGPFMSSSRLTYRGVVYQSHKPASAPEKELVTDDAKHIYRGHLYHYESKKKKAVA